MTEWPVETREEFSAATKRTLAQRAAYRCSNPECRSVTTGPHSDPDRSLTTGVAAHIHAAAPGGPRYDGAQTSEERRSLGNGIWLCHSCSDRVDKDPERYPADKLEGWKEQHDVWVDEGGGVPPLPSVELETLTGLTLPDGQWAEITGDDVERLRESVLTVSNSGAKQLYQVKLRLQLPEPVVRFEVRDSPMGTPPRVEPEKPEWRITAKGKGSSVRRVGKPRPSRTYVVGLETLPPSAGLRVAFWCVSPDSRPEDTVRQEYADQVHYHITGSYEFELGGEHVPRRFVTELQYNEVDRGLMSGPVVDDDGTLPIAIRTELV